MRELTVHEIESVAGGAIFQEVAKAALAGAAKGVPPSGPKVTLEIVSVEVSTYRP